MTRRHAIRTAILYLALYLVVLVPICLGTSVFFANAFHGTTAQGFLFGGALALWTGAQLLATSLRRIRRISRHSAALVSGVGIGLVIVVFAVATDPYSLIVFGPLAAVVGFFAYATSHFVSKTFEEGGLL